jgi:hydrogenase maturation factor
MLPEKKRIPACIPDAHRRCLTCSDDAQPATVLQVNVDESVAVVELDDVPLEIDISLVNPVAVGEVLLVHGGVALAKLGEDTST